jgi:hypothetical protein
MRQEISADEIIRRIYDIEYSINWEAVRAVFGIHFSSKIGAGFRFGGVKPEYVWPSGRPRESVSEAYDDEYVNVWYTTRKISVFVLDDLSSSMDFGYAALSKRERAAMVDAAIVFSAYKAADELTYIGFSDRVEPSMYFGPEDRNKYLPWIVANARLKFKKERKKATGISEALSFLPKNEPALCFIVSDFFPQSMFLRHISEIAFCHDVVPVVIRDIWEEMIPEEKGYIWMIDSESGEEFMIPLSSSEKIKEFIKVENERLEKGLKDLGIEAIWCRPEGDDIGTLSEFFLKRLSA